VREKAGFTRSRKKGGGIREYEGDLLFTIRIATEEDISQIVEIEQEANMPPWSHGALLSEIDKDESFFIVSVEDPAELPFCEEKAEEPSPCFIKGFALLRQVGDDGELLKIAVEKESRACGIGGLLMSAVLKHAAEKKHTSVFLEVRSGNTSAIRLYEKHGFRTVRVRKDYYCDPVEDAIVMIRGEVSL